MSIIWSKSNTIRGRNKRWKIPSYHLGESPFSHFYQRHYIHSSTIRSYSNTTTENKPLDRSQTIIVAPSPVIGIVNNRTNQQWKYIFFRQALNMVSKTADSLTLKIYWAAETFIKYVNFRVQPIAQSHAYNKFCQSFTPLIKKTESYFSSFN